MLLSLLMSSSLLTIVNNLRMKHGFNLIRLSRPRILNIGVGLVYFTPFLSIFYLTDNKSSFFLVIDGMIIIYVYNRTVLNKITYGLE